MKILFMGTPDFARVILQDLIEDGGFEVIGLFCQPDRPFGRRQELKPPETKAYVLGEGMRIPIFQPEKIGAQEVEQIQNLSFESIVVAAYGQILPKEILDFPCLNVHASLLPKYRGASPIQEMILHDQKLFGVSVIRLRERLDCGEILGVSVCENDGRIALNELSMKLAKMGASLMIKVLKHPKILPLEQNHVLASFCAKIKKEDGRVDFSEARKLVLKSRAYEGWPGIFLDSGLKLFGVEDAGFCGQKAQAGEILEIDEGGMVVACQDHRSVRIAQLQASGKNRLDAGVYAKGYKLKVGDILS